MSFGKAFRYILSVECPEGASCLSDHPTDPGGRTAYGITQHTFNGWLMRAALPPRDVWEITMAEVESIYFNKYWVGSKAAQMSPSVGMAFFDIVVNSGPNAAGRVLQRALNLAGASLEVDGIVGPKTIEVVLERRGNDYRISQEMLWQRIAQYKDIMRSLSGRGRGDTVAKWAPIWLHRVLKLRRALQHA